MKVNSGLKTGLFTIVVVILMAGFSASSRLAAQESEGGPRMLSFVTINVKPTKYGEFRKMMKEEFIPAWKKGGGTSMSVWQYQVGDGFKFIIVEPMQNFAAMDGLSPLEKGLGENAPAFYERVSGMIDGFTTHVARMKPEMSYESASASPLNVGVTVVVTVNPDREQEFEKFISKEYVPLVKKAGMDGIWASKMAFGGKANQYSFLMPHKNFAELDKGDAVRRALSPDEAKAFGDKFPKGVVYEVEVYLVRYQRDLSVERKPAGTAAN